MAGRERMDLVHQREGQPHEYLAADERPSGWQLALAVALCLAIAVAGVVVMSNLDLMRPFYPSATDTYFSGN